jgi:rod shape-determining protein MreC
LLDIRQRTGWIFLSVMIAQILLVSAQVQTRAGASVIEAVSFGAFSRVQSVTSSGVRGVRDVWSNYAELRGARDENQALKQQLAEMEVRLQEQRALAARTTKLTELLELKGATPLPMMAAEVIGGNPNATPGIREVTIGRGRADGVEANMAVIGPKGIIGRVIGFPAAHAARVQLIIDRNAAIGAIVERTRDGGLIVGTAGQPPLAMEMVSELADIKVGDLVVSSGIDGIYPKGYAIGWIDTLEKGKEEGRGLYWSISVRPAVDFNSLEEVLVVLVPAKPALTEDEKAPAAGPQR